MPDGYLLDTNAAIAILSYDSAILAFLSTLEQVYVPIICVGELYFGVENSRQADENRKRVDAFVGERRILMCDEETAREYGKLQTILRRRGRPLPQNDIWIAAIALQHQLSLITRDAHFKEIDGLNLLA